MLQLYNTPVYVDYKSTQAQNSPSCSVVLHSLWAQMNAELLPQKFVQVLVLHASGNIMLTAPLPQC